MTLFNTKQYTQIALLIALEVILSRFLSINTPLVRIGFGFIPIAVAGMLYGPFWAGGAAMLGDIIGAMLFPVGVFFPGFALTAFLTGFTYGLLVNKKVSLWRIVASVLVVTCILHLCIDTYWLYIITGKGYWALLPTRIVKCVLMVPIQVVSLRLVLFKVSSLKRYSFS